ncbi:MAG TPA: TolC family protein, partial [Salinimicrobium sp.]|nr:TolC family protein [Salinimicrobium sp.]
MKYQFIALFFIFSLGNLRAQNLSPLGRPGGAYSFTMEEAVQYALDSSYATINARRDILAAIKKKWETTARGLPHIDANVSYTNRLKQPV